MPAEIQVPLLQGYPKTILVLLYFDLFRRFIRNTLRYAVSLQQRIIIHFLPNLHRFLVRFAACLFTTYFFTACSLRIILLSPLYPDRLKPLHLVFL